MGKLIRLVPILEAGKGKFGHTIEDKFDRGNGNTEGIVNRK